MAVAAATTAGLDKAPLELEIGPADERRKTGDGRRAAWLVETLEPKAEPSRAVIQDPHVAHYHEQVVQWNVPIQLERLEWSHDPRQVPLDQAQID